ncbi:MAG: hypothetical protein E7019_00090 [Alphaproteobacteria bacterium]|nr:hypothetical protein [Alphaproteobacteria bacterium]
MKIKNLLHSFFRKKDDHTTTVVKEKTKEELLVEAREAITSGNISPELCNVILQDGTSEELKTFYTKYLQNLIPSDISSKDLFSGLKRLDSNKLIEKVLIWMIKTDTLGNIDDKEKYSLLERDVDRWSKFINFDAIKWLILDPSYKSSVLKEYCSIKGLESILLEQRIALEEGKALESFDNELWAFAVKSPLDLTPFVKHVDTEMLSYWCCVDIAKQFIARNCENEVKSLIASVMEYAALYPYEKDGRSNYSTVLTFLNILISQTSSTDLLTFAEEKRAFAQEKVRID